MTSTLAQAISNYFQRPTKVRLELGMALIRDGHLTATEERRLLETLEERRGRRKRPWR